MIISDLSLNQIRKHLSSGLRFRISSFDVSLKSSILQVAEHIQTHYGEYSLLEISDFVDFHIELSSPSILRRLFKPQVNFVFDGINPFKPLPFDQASAFFEWGLNWCIANYSNHFLIIHAAVVERNGLAFVFPGSPGSGKSTLCAALVCNGWRLLSDEMTLISSDDGLIYPALRPISLKNQSIELIKKSFPDSVFGQVVNDTVKGTVSHMRPPDQSVRMGTVPAVPAKIILPKYIKDADTSLTTLSKAKTLLRVADDCFNYHVLGENGFDLLSHVIEISDCYEFKYSRLDEAINLFSELSS